MSCELLKDKVEALYDRIDPDTEQGSWDLLWAELAVDYLDHEEPENLKVGVENARKLLAKYGVDFQQEHSS